MLGRAGLGNELFPVLRAFDIATQEGAEMIPPRWMQARIGPWLRRELDSRQYWKIFAPVSVRQRLHALGVELCVVTSARLPMARRLIDDIRVVKGMDGYFAALSQPSARYRSYLRSVCRPSELSPSINTPYLSFHIRLGDFMRSSPDAQHVLSNNTATPLSWYFDQAVKISAKHPAVPILISSDGTDQELESLLRLPQVRRTAAKNALDEIFIIAGACGLVGSRSTFSAWGAFLGEVPMLVMKGGNAYMPHAGVWEDRRPASFDSWLTATEERIAGRNRF